jgi:hypothetical protein
MPQFISRPIGWSIRSRRFQCAGPLQSPPRLSGQARRPGARAWLNFNESVSTRFTHDHCRIDLQRVRGLCQTQAGQVPPPHWVRHRLRFDPRLRPGAGRHDWPRRLCGQPEPPKSDLSRNCVPRAVRCARPCWQFHVGGPGPSRQSPASRFRAIRVCSAEPSDTPSRIAGQACDGADARVGPRYQDGLAGFVPTLRGRLTRPESRCSGVKCISV